MSPFEATENKNYDLPLFFGSMDDSLPGNLTSGLNPMTGFDLKTTAKEFSSRVLEESVATVAFKA